MILNDTCILFDIMLYVGEVGFVGFGRSRYAYRVSKTHRMPGRAASGGALAPEQEGRQERWDPTPYRFQRVLFPFFPPTFSKIGRFLNLRLYFNREVRF